MANWYGTSRSNYFRVKNEEAFEQFVTCTGVDHWVNDEDKSLHAIAPDDSDDGFWPGSFYDEETKDYVEINFEEMLAKHLADGEVAILMTSGAEKLRYVTGYATAIHSSGETVSISINDIYEIVKNKWSVETTLAEY